MPNHPLKVDEKFHLMFAPESWTPLGKLSKFLGPPFTVTSDLYKAIQDSIDRSHRFETLVALSSRIQPTLVEDAKEFKKNGYTPASRSKEFAALVETILCELYSILDALRYTIYWAYRGRRGVQKKSTSKLFSRAAEEEYDEDFPEGLRTLLAQAYNDWFPELRRLRTELTHGGTGSCHFDVDTSKINYMHSGLGQTTRALVIDDIVEKVNTLANAVFTMMRAIGKIMYESLEGKKEVQVVCGFYRGNIYTRLAYPENGLNFQSGICNLRQWFEDEPDCRCPLAEKCHAYRRAIN